MPKRANKKGFVRVTVTVSTELKKKMTKHNESVNWSAVACDAFESKVTEMERKTKMGENMSDLVSKMREMDAEDQGESYNSGYKAGQLCVNKAWLRPKQLRRLKTWYDSEHFDLVLCESYSDRENAKYEVYYQLVPENRNEHKEADNFWEEMLGDDAEACAGDVDFMRGFCNGAVDAWDDISNQV